MFDRHFKGIALAQRRNFTYIQLQGLRRRRYILDFHHTKYSTKTFNLRQYTCLELARYIKPRLQNWIKSGGFHLYNKHKGWRGSEEEAVPFYIDFWEEIEKKEIRILDWRFVKKEETPLDRYFETIKDVCKQETNKKLGQKRKRSSNA